MSCLCTKKIWWWIQVYEKLLKNLDELSHFMRNILFSQTKLLFMFHVKCENWNSFATQILCEMNLCKSKASETDNFDSFMDSKCWFVVNYTRIFKKPSKLTSISCFFRFVYSKSFQMIFVWLQNFSKDEPNSKVVNSNGPHSENKHFQLPLYNQSQNPKCVWEMHVFIVLCSHLNQ